MTDRKIGIIGAGKMGQALLEGFLAKGIYQKEDIAACTRQVRTAKALSERLGIACGNDPREVVASSKTILLAVKPHMTDRVLKQVSDLFTPEHTLISVMSGVPTEFLEDTIGIQLPVYRAMPNTPALVGEGMSVLCKGRYCNEEGDTMVEQLFASVGTAAWIDEEQMNPSTGFSGAGPAYVYVFIEAMSDAGVKLGLSRDLSVQMAAQTVKGAAEMVLKTGLHPAQLKDKVTTPAGVTIDGVMELEAQGLRVAIIKAIVVAAERAEELF